MTEPLYLLTVTEDEVIALSQGHISPSLKEKASTILKPLTRADQGQASFVYTADREEQEGHGEVHRLS